MVEKLTNEEISKSVSNRTEVIGKQNTLFGSSIDLVQFKNLKQKQETKAKVLSKFKGEIFRSIINTKELGGNKRLDKLERQSQSGNRDSVSNVLERADSFGKKTLNTLSTFSSTITMAYTNLLSKEGDITLDLFAGHNSRCADILSMNRKYVGFDVHTFPLEMCNKYGKEYGEENYLLLKQSSEDLPFANETFDFALTCPPYFCAEKYEEIYEEECDKDLSGKDYEEFLRLYEKCYQEQFRCLKNGSFAVVVIGDVHKNGRLYTLGMDTVNICRNAGFILHDWNILNRGSNIGGDLNPVMFLEKLKRFPTIHEWILVFKKPEVKK